MIEACAGTERTEANGGWRTNQFFYRGEFIELGKAWGLFGAYLGICFDVIYFGGTAPSINRTGKVWKALLRILVCAAIALPYIAINYSVRFTLVANGFPLTQLFKEVLPLFIWLMFAFSALRILLQRCKLVSTENDLQSGSDVTH
jgi:hypothetical protein